MTSTQDSTKRVYKCSKCGLPKKGHICPEENQSAAANTELAANGELVNDASQQQETSTAVDSVESSNDTQTKKTSATTKRKGKRSRKKQTKDEPVDATKPTHLVTIQIPSKFVIPVQCRSREAPVKTVPPPYYLLPEFSPQLTILGEDELFLTIEQIGDKKAKRGWKLQGSEFLKSYCTAMDLEAKVEIEPQSGEAFTLLSFNIDGSDLPGCPYTSTTTGDAATTNNTTAAAPVLTDSTLEEDGTSI